MGDAHQQLYVKCNWEECKAPVCLLTSFNSIQQDEGKYNKIFCQLHAPLPPIKFEMPKEILELADKKAKAVEPNQANDVCVDVESIDHVEEVKCEIKPMEIDDVNPDVTIEPEPEVKEQINDAKLSLSNVEKLNVDDIQTIEVENIEIETNNEHYSPSNQVDKMDVDPQPQTNVNEVVKPPTEKEIITAPENKESEKSQSPEKQVAQKQIKTDFEKSPGTQQEGNPKKENAGTDITSPGPDILKLTTMDAEKQKMDSTSVNMKGISTHTTSVPEMPTIITSTNNSSTPTEQKSTPDDKEIETKSEEVPQSSAPGIPGDTPVTLPAPPVLIHDSPLQTTVVATHADLLESSGRKLSDEDIAVSSLLTLSAATHSESSDA